MDGQASVHLSGGYAGVVGLAPSGGVISQSGRSATDLAELLSPPPLPRPRDAWYIWTVVLLVYVGCWAGMGVVAWPDAADQASGVSPVTGVLAPLACAAPGIIALALVVAGLVRATRRDRIRRRVDPYVAEVYSQAWYCGRCAGVFFRPGTVPAHVHVDRLIPVVAFRDTIWLYGYHSWQAQR